MNQQYKTYKVLGIMSGTSLDGIDFCLSEFRYNNSKWEYSILESETIPYERYWKESLVQAEQFKGADLIRLHFEYGHFLGGLSKKFLDKRNLSTELIASHGHTIFHQIDKGFTFQLGHGASIAASSEIKTISDFRSLDVALGGQGAPLVPFGDQFLFDEYSFCLNLGGIANLSYQKSDERIAFDIAPANMILNHLCKESGIGEFDNKGAQSRTGEINEELLNELNDLDFYQELPPKSLGKEWVFDKVIPIINSYSISVADKLNTFSHHLASQINDAITDSKLIGKTLVTGGGAKNDYLIELIKSNGLEIKIPEDKVIDFKEALIFAFLGLNRVLNKDNTLKSVTGALKNSCGGTVFFP